MKIRSKYTLILLLFAMWIQTTGYTQKIHKQELQSTIASQVTKGFNGVVLVAKNSQPVLYKAYGYRTYADKKPLKKNDIFELASISKQFTAAIILILQQQGKLNIDDPLEKYVLLPYKGITIEHLLTHTSGLPDYHETMDKYWDKSKVAGNEDCIEYLNRYAPPKLFEPGVKYAYSNTGYLLLATIAERASGRDFIDLCDEYIFQKLAMKSFAIRTPAEKLELPRLAVGHIKTENGYIAADSFPSSNYTIWLGNRKGPGRVSGNARDLLKWDRALYINNILDATSKESAFSPATLSDGSRINYGYGWAVDTTSPAGRKVYHTGDNPGYKNIIIRLYDHHYTIIILSNNAYDVSSLAAEIENLIR